MAAKDHYDVIIVGAGLSGIGAAFHLQEKCPDQSIAILEARSAMGGTWDLFRYPGIRSDSDMFTLGYIFKPWIAKEAIADGPAILEYIHETAKENGIDKKIRYNHKVVGASWSTDASKWTLTIDHGEGTDQTEMSCNFIFMCSGYYDYDEGYTPDFEGVDHFSGSVVHPQKWTSEIDYAGKKVIVIGSGATAITLVPEMAKTAKHVTMLQRSPTYVVSAPERDSIANFLRKVLPNKTAYAISRWKNILYSILMFKVCRKWPKFMRGLIMKGVEKQLGKEYDIEKHFGPKYNPWDQRLCLVPDNDLFESINHGSSSVVTDHIERFTEKGILTRSGQELEADIIVTATGLKLKFLAGMNITVDDKELDSSSLFCYRGMMFNDVPNLAAAFGYTNASWTLKCDLTCDYVCRLLNYMDEKGIKQTVPRLNDDSVKEEPLLDFNSGYVLRSIKELPKQGSKRPWKVYQNYILDIFNFRHSKLQDGVLEFS